MASTFALLISFAWAQSETGGAGGTGGMDDTGGAAQAEHDLEHEEGERNFTEVTSFGHRLVVTYDGGVVTLDTANGEVIDNHSMPGFLRLNTAGDGRHVLVTTSEGWEVFDVGLDTVDHGDHYHYYEAEPHWSGSVFSAETPAHVVTHAGLTALFDDDTGQVILFDPSKLGDGEVETDTSYAVPEAHHGVAVPLAGDELIVTVGNTDERIGAALLNADREVIAEADNCPGVHGETVAADDVVVVGCEDGPIVLRGDQWHKVEVDTGDDGYARTGNLFGTHVSPVVLGDYRPGPDEPMTSVALIDTRDDSLSTTEVDAPYTFRNLARGLQSEALVLTESGTLHIIDPESGEITNSVEGVVEAWVEPEAWQEPRPTLAVADEIVYVTEPATQQVHAVDIVGGEVLDTYALGVVPNEIEVVTGFASEGASESRSDSQSDSQGDRDDQAQEATASGDAAGTRLLVTDAESTDAHVVALEDNAVLASFSTPGEAGRAYPSSNGRFGFVVHRDENRVSLVHSGLTVSDHGDHMDLIQGAPYVAATMNVGREPTHFFAHDNDIAVFNDEDGTVALLDQRLLGLSLDYDEITVAEPDHGAPVVHGNHVLSGYYDLERVDIYERGGALVQSIEGCPGLHGAGHSGDSVVYGCEDGVLLIQANGSEFSSSKLPNPADAPEDMRVGTVAAHEDSPVMVGNFGEGVVVIDPAAETLTPVALSANPLGMTFADGETLIALTADGQLHALEPASGEVVTSVQVMGAGRSGHGGGGRGPS